MARSCKTRPATSPAAAAIAGDDFDTLAARLPVTEIARHASPLTTEAVRAAAEAHEAWEQAARQVVQVAPQPPRPKTWHPDPRVAARQAAEARRDALGRALTEAERRFAALQDAWKVTGGGGITKVSKSSGRALGVVRRCEEMHGTTREEKRANARAIVDEHNRAREAAAEDVRRLRRMLRGPERYTGPVFVNGREFSFARVTASEIAAVINASGGSECRSRCWIRSRLPTPARRSATKVERLEDLPPGSAALDLGDGTFDRRVIITWPDGTRGGCSPGDWHAGKAKGPFEILAAGLLREQCDALGMIDTFRQTAEKARELAREARK